MMEYKVCVDNYPISSHTPVLGSTVSQVENQPLLNSY